MILCGKPGFVGSYASSFFDIFCLNDVTGELKSPHLFVPNQDHDLTSRLSFKVNRHSFLQIFFCGLRQACNTCFGACRETKEGKFMKSS